MPTQKKSVLKRSTLHRVGERLVRGTVPDRRVSAALTLDEVVARERPPGTETGRTWSQVTHDGDVQHWVTFEGPEPDQMTTIGLYVYASPRVRRMASSRDW